VKALETLEGRRLVVITPSRIGPPLREALRAAAAANKIPIFEVAGLESAAQESPPEGLIVSDGAAAVDPGQARRTVVFLGDPDHAAGSACGEFGVEGFDAVISASRCCAHAMDVARAADVHIVFEAEFLANPTGALGALLQLLELPLGGGAANAVGEQFVQAVQALAAPAHLAEDEIGSVALALYKANGSKAPSAWWNRTLFKAGDSSPEVCPPVIDITGGGRILVRGPHIILPAGTWRLTAVFDLCDEGARRIFMAGFGSGADFTHERLWSATPGRNQLSVVHPFKSAGPAQLHLSVPYGAFHGEIRFHGATIEGAVEIATT